MWCISKVFRYWIQDTIYSTVSLNVLGKRWGYVKSVFNIDFMSMKSRVPLPPKLAYVLSNMSEQSSEEKSSETIQWWSSVLLAH